MSMYFNKLVPIFPNFLYKNETKFLSVHAKIFFKNVFPYSLYRLVSMLPIVGTFVKNPVYFINFEAKSVNQR